MRSALKRLIRAAVFVAASLAGVFTQASAQLRPQIRDEIQVYPFSKGTREDSLAMAKLRVTKLMDARKFFEKTYLRKELVYVPLSQSYTSLFTSKKYLRFSEIRQLKPGDVNLTATYNKMDALLQRVIEAENKEIRRENKLKLERIKAQPQTQEDLLDLSNRSDYEILFAPKNIFNKIDPKDPRENRITDSVSDEAEQVLLGKPHNIDGYVNSVNYQSFDLTHLKMPDLIEVLLQEDLRLCKKIVTKASFAARVRDIRINYQNFDGSSKLWITTNLSRGEIYLSPYLIRAVFNISLYQDRLFKLAEDVVQHGDDLQVYFSGKSGASVKQVDSAYFMDFAERFSKNILFVIGHELAHVYLPGTSINTDIETACDTYSAYFYLSYFHELQLGVFENLLIKSISSNELDFWGKKINKDALLARYKDLTTVRKTKDIKTARCRIEE